MIRIVLTVIICISTFTTTSAESSLVQIRPDIKLEVVEWGGEGQPMVFLAGLGHAAYVFDNIAPRFTDKYRVLGITRRGFGGSSCPEAGYDLSTLAEDIRLVMDSLHIKRAILVGHSLAGDEMTKFASLYPDRLLALIYLEAAYDRVITRDSLSHYTEPESIVPEPTTDDLESVTAFKAYYAKVNGVEIPESDFLAICNWDSNGVFVGWKSPGHVYQAIHKGLEHPAFESVAVPALAIYAVDYPITEHFADYAERDTLTQRQMRTRYEAGQRVEALSHDEFQRKVKKSRVVKINGAGHSLYITHASRVEAEIRLFLSNISQ